MTAPLLARHATEPAWWAPPIRWTAFHPKTRHACDECVARLHATHGHGPRPEAAAHKRTSGGTTLLACGAHKTEWRTAEDARRRRAA